MPSITDKANRAKVIFLLGRPGSGKTLAIHLMAQYLQSVGFDRSKIVVYDDYDILWTWFRQDRNQRDFEPSPQGGFRVKNFEILDRCLCVINDRALRELETKQFAFMEFSRRSYVPAFENFDDELIESSITAYIQAPLSICLKRNAERAAEADDNKTGFVPPDVLETYYKHDDIELLVEKFSDAVVQIDNSQNGIAHFRDRLVEKVFCRLGL